MKTKQIILAFCLGTLLTLCGCFGNQGDTFPSTAISNIDMKANGHIEQLSGYDSPYTVCYKNKDHTYSMYIFSSPIQYKTEDSYKIIENSIIKSSLEEFSFENKSNDIKTYFPAKISDYFMIRYKSFYIKFKPHGDFSDFSAAEKLQYTNMFGTAVECIIYKNKKIDMLFYTSKFGIQMEIVVKDKTDVDTMEFNIETNSNNDFSYVNTQNKYVVLKQNNENKAIIYSPIIKYSNTDKKDNPLNLDGNIQFIKGNKSNTIKLFFNKNNNNVKQKYPIFLNSSFEIYQDKMPDSGVCSNIDKNLYLSRYNLIGTHEEYGTCYQYLRLRFKHFFDIEPNNIISSYYCADELTSINNNFQMKLWKVKDQWSSTNLVWSEQPDYQYEVSNININHGGLCKFDITKFVKECISDESASTESLGLLLKSNDNKQYRILGSSDNSMYSPYMVVNLISLPKTFNIRESINPLE